eukprot:444268_1
MPRMSRNDTVLSIFKNKQYKFDIIRILGLNKQDIAELFVELCYYQFDGIDIENNDELNELFDGKPGNVKRVAAFYQFLCRTEEDINIQINLDIIVTKLKTTHQGWITEFNKTVPSVFHDRSRTVNGSRTIGSHVDSLRNVHHLREKSQYSHKYLHGININNIQYNKTIQIQKPNKMNSIPDWQLPNSNKSTNTPMIPEEKDNTYIISIIEKSKDLNDLKPVLEGIPIKELKRMLMQHYNVFVTNFNSLNCSPFNSPVEDNNNNNNNNYTQRVSAKLKRKSGHKI